MNRSLPHDTIRRLVAVCAVSLAATVAAPKAAADDAPPAANVELAERLFVEGRILAARGDHRAACARFDASRKLDPRAVGTVLNLAICNEALGRYASAARYFREVADRSRGTRPDRVELAEGRLREVEPKVVTLRVTVVTAARIPGLTVTLDGEPLASDQWGAAFPSDAGEHVLEATAPGRTPSRQVVVVGPTGAETTVEVLSLAPPPPPAPEPTAKGRDRTLGTVVAATGLAVTLAGLGVGATVAAECGGLFRRTCRALDEADDASAAARESSLATRSVVATAASAVGLATIGVGAFLFFRKPGARTAVVVPTATPSAAAVSLHARF